MRYETIVVFDYCYSKRYIREMDGLSIFECSLSDEENAQSEDLQNNNNVHCVKNVFEYVGSDCTMYILEYLPIGDIFDTMSKSCRYLNIVCNSIHVWKTAYKQIDGLKSIPNDEQSIKETVILEYPYWKRYSVCFYPTAEIIATTMSTLRFDTARYLNKGLDEYSILQLYVALIEDEYKIFLKLLDTRRMQTMAFDNLETFIRFIGRQNAEDNKKTIRVFWKIPTKDTVDGQTCLAEENDQRVFFSDIEEYFEKRNAINRMRLQQQDLPIYF